MTANTSSTGSAPDTAGDNADHGADIDIRRVYDSNVRDGSALRGATFLVDGMWPRGVRKDELELDGWLKGLAPSSNLRKWFGHRADRWETFRQRYREELDGAPEALAPLMEAARRGPVTLLYQARDTEHNNAVVLREYVRDHVEGRAR